MELPENKLKKARPTLGEGECKAMLVLVHYYLQNNTLQQAHVAVFGMNQPQASR